jgi:RimJ/RimL family protein N-acetyltransferase
LTRDEFIQTGREWALKKNAKVYCIFTDTPIGQISISNITHDGHAQLGYWITSREWRKGYGTKALELVIQKARELGIREVSANIDDQNAASLALWQKYRHVERMIEQNRVRVRLRI